MRFAIDLVFVSWPPTVGGSLVVIQVRERVTAFRIVTCPGRPRELAAVELEAGCAAAGAIAPGATLIATCRPPA